MDNQEENSEIDKQNMVEDAVALEEFQLNSTNLSDQLKFDLQADDASSIKILIDLAKSHATSDEEHRALRHLTKRLAQF